MASAATEVTDLGKARVDFEREVERETGKARSGLLARYLDWPVGIKFRALSAVSGTIGICMVSLGWYSLTAIETAVAEAGHTIPVVSEIAGTAKTGFALLICAALFWMVFANFRFAKDVSRALARVTGLLKDVTDGKVDMDIPYVERRDEIGRIAHSLEVFKRASVRLQKVRQEREDGLLREQEARDERQALRERQQEALKEMAVDFEQMVSNVVASVASASSQLNSTACSMAASADESSTQIGAVDDAMEAASKGVTAAAAASDEFAMSIGEISRQASNSAELARKASDTADEANKTISALSSSANEIGQVVELIQNIAQHTNLLALNASIEAARGGDSGRGFAVVASEVKELASRTSKATHDVADQISAMQDSTEASVAALQSIGTQIQQMEATAVSIATAVDQQAVAGQDLARSIDVAARGADEASTNIGKVRDSTLSTGAAASQVLDSSNDLEEQATTLSEQVGKFLNRVRTMDSIA